MHMRPCNLLVSVILGTLSEQSLHFKVNMLPLPSSIRVRVMDA